MLCLGTNLAPLYRAGLGSPYRQAIIMLHSIRTQKRNMQPQSLLLSHTHNQHVALANRNDVIDTEHNSDDPFTLYTHKHIHFTVSAAQGLHSESIANMWANLNTRTHRS